MQIAYHIPIGLLMALRVFFRLQWHRSLSISPEISEPFIMSGDVVNLALKKDNLILFGHLRAYWLTAVVAFLQHLVGC